MTHIAANSSAPRRVKEVQGSAFTSGSALFCFLSYPAAFLDPIGKSTELDSHSVEPTFLRVLSSAIAARPGVTGSDCQELDTQSVVLVNDGEGTRS
ncbi:MAG: hypothetical protein QOF27_2861 [Gaiellaceae bacterium]|jgi:hypothetical protein|nr:hypothetical protein [Gaiellaceae bacterium]